MQLEQVLRAHYAATRARVAAQAVVLAVQDTITLNHQLPLEQKESVKWLRGYQAPCRVAQACPDTTVVGVGDREAEIYELVLAAVQARAAGLPRAEILLRAMRE